MGVLKTQPSEVYNMDYEDIKFFRQEADMYLEAMRKAQER